MSAHLQVQLKQLADRAQTLSALLAVIHILDPQHQGESLSMAASMANELEYDALKVFDHNFYCPEGLPAAPRSTGASVSTINAEAA